MLLGADWAGIDGNAAPDLTLAKMPSSDGSRLSFVALRATWGKWSDTTFMRDWPALKAARLVRIAYFYPRYTNNGALLPISTQIEAGLIAITKGGGLDRGRDLIALDIESSEGPRNSGAPAGTALAWYAEFAAQLRITFGMRPLIYTSNRVWHEDLADQLHPELARCPPWLAKPWPWPVGTPAYRAISAAFADGFHDPKVPTVFAQGAAGSKNWWIHQYMGDVRRGSWPGLGQVDANRFNVMRLGATGGAVRWVQKALQMAEGTPGVFEDAMAASVREFQAAHQLDVDAVIGPRTFAALCWR